MSVSFSTDPRKPGPLDAGTATALLDQAERSLAENEPQTAAALAQRVQGQADPAVAARAMVVYGDAVDRLGYEDEALTNWRNATRMPPSPATYQAWRRVAATLVRRGDVAGALDAYQRADTLAPPEDRAEIAARIGWLSKELGDERGARRAFARSRGGQSLPIATIGIIAATSIISLAALQDGSGQLFTLLQLDKPALVAGEWYRLLSPTLVHGNLLHLAFNMFALWIAGSLVERLYGPAMMLGLYVLCGAAGSAASLAFGGPYPSVGASGAIFGFFGILFAVQRVHDPVLDRQARAAMAQMGGLIVANLVLNVVMNGGAAAAGGGPGIDIAAHVGGLVAGLWLAYLLVPTRVATIGSMWERPEGSEDPSAARRLTAFRLAGIAGLIAVIVALVLIGPIVALG